MVYRPGPGLLNLVDLDEDRAALRALAPGLAESRAVLPLAGLVYATHRNPFSQPAAYCGLDALYFESAGMVLRPVHIW